MCDADPLLLPDVFSRDARAKTRMPLTVMPLFPATGTAACALPVPCGATSNWLPAAAWLLTASGPQHIRTSRTSTASIFQDCRTFLIHFNVHIEACSAYHSPMACVRSGLLYVPA